MTALLSATCGAAAAQPAAKGPAARAPAAAAPVSDVRCLMDMFILAQQAQPQQKQTGQAGILFFAGRISARGAGQDLASAMKAQIATLQPPQVQAELPRCGALFQATMQSVDAGMRSLRPPGAAPAPGAAAPAPGTPSAIAPPAPAPQPAAPAPK